MMKRFLFLSMIILCFNSNAQNQFGAGINIGVRNTGLELQYYFLNRIKIYGGASLSRYSSFSNRIGICLFLLPNDKQHNFGLTNSIEYKYGKTTILEKEDVFYSYNTNALNYLNFGGVYTFKIYFDDSKKNAFLFEVELFWKQLLNQLIITENNNQQESIQLQNSIERYYKSGLGLSIGMKLIF
ncbi:hypothetical protein [Brumimicrobium sp.]|uniref:hypothetical protein n=1 Tax=Brumimicrobium sp. TaxID=2029867 RepID=UPI003A8F3B97